METPQELMSKYVTALNAGNWFDVVEHTTEIIKQNDKLAHVWANRAAALSHLGQHVDALLNVDRALALEPSAAHYANKGCFYWELGNANEALRWLHESVAAEPIAQAKLTMGNIYKHRKQMNKALKCYRECIELDPNYADGHLVLSMTLLEQGFLEEGWKEYEWRWKTTQLPPRKMKAPQWKGEDLTNKTILVYGEQGLGDQIQFARYGRLLANRFPRAKVILEVKPHLRRLVEKTPDIYAVINSGDKLPDIDYAVPMLTLAGMMTPNIGSIRAEECEFDLSHYDVSNWGDRLEENLPEKYKDHLKVGICWAGMTRTEHPHAAAVDKIRSTSLSNFAPLAQIPNILWVSLQKGPPAAQIKAPPTGMTILDSTDDMVDFYDTCCAIANLDLVITVDTAVLHAAASIGKPTWLLSRWNGCWRWFGDREDSPWYPSLRQFTQPAPNDWEGMMKKVASELTKFVEGHVQPELDLTNDLSYLPHAI